MLVLAILCSALIGVAAARAEEQDLVEGWAELSSGYGLEELRRYAEPAGETVRDSFDGTDSLFASIAGGVDWTRQFGPDDMLVVSSDMRNTHYAIDTRKSRTDLTIDLALSHEMLADKVRLKAGVRAEEAMRGDARFRTRIIAQGSVDLRIGPQTAVTGTAGLRRIENQREAMRGSGDDIRIGLTHRLGKLAELSARARQYREYWKPSTRAYSQTTGGAALKLTPAGRFEARLSAFTAHRHYGQRADLARPPVHDRQWGANLDLRYRLGERWRAELGTSIKQRRSNEPSRDRQDRLVALALLYRL